MSVTVDELRGMVNKAMGEDVLHKGSDEKFKTKYIPTGVLPIDILLQGGIPRNRFTLIQGDWSTLKSYIGYKACAETQKLGGVAAVIDNEHAYDRDWAEHIGINTANLIVQHPKNGEQAIDTAEVLIRGGVDMILFDSVSATTPQAEQEKRLYGENIQPGRLAALMSIAGRRLTTANSRTAMIWVNQLRENIGMTFGPREKGTGGRALPYYSSYILDVKKVGKITRDDRMFTGDKWQPSKTQIGQKFKAELSKSKLNKPFRDIWFDWSLTDSDIDIIAFLFMQGIEHGIITQKGSSYTYKTMRVSGKDKFKLKLATQPDVVAALEADIMHAHGLPGKVPVLRKTTGKTKSMKRLR